MARHRLHTGSFYTRKTMRTTAKPGSMAYLQWSSTRGSLNPNAKLTEEQAMAIKVSTGEAAKVAEDFGISKQLVHDIRAGRRWRHLRIDE